MWLCVTILLVCLKCTALLEENVLLIRAILSVPPGGSMKKSGSKHHGYMHNRDVQADTETLGTNLI
jgi:hypothetical protein